jgi:hypothetical protein
MSLYAYNRGSGVTFSIEKPGIAVDYVELEDNFTPEMTKQYRVNDGSLSIVERLMSETTEDEETPVTLESLQEENKLLKAQVQAQSDRSDFLEDCIAEMALEIY